MYLKKLFSHELDDNRGDSAQTSQGARAPMQNTPALTQKTQAPIHTTHTCSQQRHFSSQTDQLRSEQARSYSQNDQIRSQPSRLIEFIRFCIVGGMNYIVDLTVFNLLLLTIWSDYPLSAKILAVTIATIFSWFMNRHWTFHHRRTSSRIRELISFALVNVLGMLPALACLHISHYLLGFTSVMADNISANIVGLIIGTILRYICYRTWVFTGRS